MNKFKQQAKRAMTTRGQKACLVIDHLVEALANDPSSSLRRAAILNYIDENPKVTQTTIMQHLDIGKSAMNREIDWLYNYGCVTRKASKDDARLVELETCGYSKRALESALDYFPTSHKGLRSFINRYVNLLAHERSTLRDARIISTIHDKGDISKSEIMKELYNGPATTDNRAYNKLVNDKVIIDG